MTLKSFYTKGLTLFSLHIGSIYDPKRQSHPGPNSRPEPGDEFQVSQEVDKLWAISLQRDPPLPSIHPSWSGLAGKPLPSRPACSSAKD